ELSAREQKEFLSERITPSLEREEMPRVRACEWSILLGSAAKLPLRFHSATTLALKRSWTPARGSHLTPAAVRFPDDGPGSHATRHGWRMLRAKPIRSLPRCSFSAV